LKREPDDQKNGRGQLENEWNAGQPKGN